MQRMQLRTAVLVAGAVLCSMRCSFAGSRRPFPPPLRPAPPRARTLQSALCKEDRDRQEKSESAGTPERCERQSASASTYPQSRLQARRSFSRQPSHRSPHRHRRRRHLGHPNHTIQNPENQSQQRQPAPASLLERKAIFGMPLPTGAEISRAGFRPTPAFPRGYPNTVTFGANTETPTTIGGVSAENAEGSLSKVET